MSEKLTFDVDVGNTRIKFGVFESAATNASLPSLPTCLAALALPVAEDLDWGKITAHFAAWGKVVARAVIAGANPAGVQRVLSGWPQGTALTPLAVARAAELPLRVNLEFPDKVGIDRLLD